MEVRDVQPNVKVVISVPFAPSTTESHVQVNEVVSHTVVLMNFQVTIFREKSLTGFI